jgi:methylmalonyl-CoA mutase N-terminal domain/subunit
MAAMEPVYTHESLRGLDARDSPSPGEFPYTRGITPTATAASCGRCGSSPASARRATPTVRYRALLEAGRHRAQRGIRPADADGARSGHPLALGEVGKCGVSVTSLADMEALFAGIDLGAVSTSMTINSPAPMLLAMYLVVAERQGVPWTALRGTLRTTS